MGFADGQVDAPAMSATEPRAMTSMNVNHFQIAIAADVCHRLRTARRAVDLFHRTAVHDTGETSEVLCRWMTDIVNWVRESSDCSS